MPGVYFFCFCLAIFCKIFILTLVMDEDLAKYRKAEAKEVNTGHLVEQLEEVRKTLTRDILLEDLFVLLDNVTEEPDSYNVVTRESAELSYSFNVMTKESAELGFKYQLAHELMTREARQAHDANRRLERMKLTFDRLFNM